MLSFNGMESGKRNCLKSGIYIESGPIVKQIYTGKNRTVAGNKSPGD